MELISMAVSWVLSLFTPKRDLAKETKVANDNIKDANNTIKKVNKRSAETLDFTDVHDAIERARRGE